MGHLSLQHVPSLFSFPFIGLELVVFALDVGFGILGTLLHRLGDIVDASLLLFIARLVLLLVGMLLLLLLVTFSILSVLVLVLLRCGTCILLVCILGRIHHF